jgi:hypothetical protein
MREAPLTSEDALLPAGGGERRRATLSKVAGLVGLVLAGTFIFRIVARPDRNQWDLKIYRAAAQALHQGLDPYDPAVLSRLDPGSRGLPFVYPPLTLYAFLPLTLLPAGAAYYLWLAAKLLALALLLWVWHRAFVPLRPMGLCLLFLLYAFCSALPIDLRVGNVSVFEQLGLWLAFSQLLRGRAWLFAALVVLAAQLKLLPAAFLVLLLVYWDRPRWGPFFASAAVFLGTLAANRFLHPEMFSRFWALASGLDERGAVNPCSLALIREVTREWRGMPGWVPVAIYAAFSAGIVIASARACRAHRAKLRTPLGVFFACATYALVAPRFKDYSYILLFAPALHVLRTFPESGRVPLFAVLLFLPSGFVFAPHLAALYPYLPVFSAALLWWELRARVRGGARSLVDAGASGP